MAAGRIFPVFFALVSASLWGQDAPAAARLPGDAEARVALAGSVHPRLAGLAPIRAVAPAFPMDHMLLVLKMAPEATQRLQGLLRDQQDPASPSYHQWLTPEAFGQRFGPGQTQVDAATLWLLQQGFKVDSVARSGLSITFSGTASQVGAAFRTAIMEYDVGGVLHHGNATAVSLPQALTGFVSGVASLHDLRAKPHPKLVRSLGPAGSLRPAATDSSGYTFIGPMDFAAIYDLFPLFNAGITGKGVTIGIVGQTDINVTDHATFLQTFGLSQAGDSDYSGSLTVVHNGADPGFVDPGDEGESELDTQWASATAPGAAIQLVVSPSSATTGGIDLSAQYLVEKNEVSVISVSYGACEQDMGSSSVQYYGQLWAQAAGQGISVFVSSGDSGAAGCDDPASFTASGGKSVSGLASSPYNTCVGGTMFTGKGSTYWKTSTSATTTLTALGYVPEAPWNESSQDSGFRLLAGGGGVSTVFAKPSWQSAPGVPADGMRDVPDVAFNAAVYNNPTAVIIDGVLQVIGGTSIATPCMAGIMALVLQKTGVRQGNPNPTLYKLGNAQYSRLSGAPKVFNDITSGNNSVPGQPGYLAGTGFDLATGLGSLDATALVNNWSAGANPITVTASPASLTVASGQTVSFTGQASDASGTGNLTGFWTFGNGDTAKAVLTNGQVAAVQEQFSLTGGQSQTFTAALTVTDGLNVQTSAPILVTVTQPVSPVITMPVADCGGFPGTPIVFTATAATLTPGASIRSYAWDFGDGATALGQQVSHTFAENDSTYWQVTLTVTDSTGATGVAIRQVLSDTYYLMDYTGSSRPDVRDLLSLASAWQGPSALVPTPANFNGLNASADLNGDGVVNDLDLDLWIAHFTPVAP